MGKSMSVTENMYSGNVNTRHGTMKKWVMKSGGLTSILINLLQTLVVTTIIISLTLLVAMSLLRFIVYQ